MDHRADHARACRYRHPHKILLPRPPRIARLRIDADVEPRQPARSADKKNKADEDPDMHQLPTQLRMLQLRQHAEPPNVRQQTRRNSERNHVRQRVQLLAEVARRVRHPCNNAVEPIEQNRNPQRQRRPVKVTLVRYRSLDALRNRVVAGSHIACGKQRRKNIHAATRLTSHLPAGTNLRLIRHQATTAIAALSVSTGSSGSTASTVEPPFTRDPVFTFRFAAAGIRTSTREPNLISPIRCPRSTLSPTFRLHTIRRASSPAICLKLTSYPPASIVIKVCSFCSTDSGFIAFMNSPLRNSHTVTTPPTGTRFTCTSKTFRKMLSLNRLPLIVSIHSASVTRPSPGETICPGPCGTVRFGSRKNHRKNAASTIGNAVSQAGILMYQSTAATAPSPKA